MTVVSLGSYSYFDLYSQTLNTITVIDNASKTCPTGLIRVDTCASPITSTANVCSARSIAVCSADPRCLLVAGVCTPNCATAANQTACTALSCSWYPCVVDNCAAVSSTMLSRQGCKQTLKAVKGFFPCESAPGCQFDQSSQTCTSLAWRTANLPSTLYGSGSSNGLNQCLDMCADVVNACVNSSSCSGALTKVISVMATSAGCSDRCLDLSRPVDSASGALYDQAGESQHAGSSQSATLCSLSLAIHLRIMYPLAPVVHSLCPPLPPLLVISCLQCGVLQRDVCMAAM